MKAQDDLNAAWTAFNRQLSDLDAQDGLGPERAKAMRLRVTEHLSNLTSVLGGKTVKCAKHPTELAHNCGSCRGEEIGKAHDDPPTKGQHLPPTHPDARLIDERRVGEGVAEGSS